jgi:hypothetical protein
MTKFLDNPSLWELSSFGDRGASVSPMATGVMRGSTQGVRPQTVYDPSLSWDGMSVNPQAFSKLNIDPRVAGKLLLAGAQVLYTDVPLPGGVFHSVPRAGKGLAAVPSTLEQQDCRFDAAAAAPAVLVARSSGALALTYQPQKFSNMLMRPAQVGVAPTHAAVASSIAPVAGGLGQLTRYLLTPQERRAVQSSEQQQKAAEDVAKKAELQRRRLVQTLRDRYPQGACQVDGAANLSSEVYGARAQQRLSLDQRAAAHAEGRRQRLHAATGLVPRYGHNPFHANEEWLSRKDTKFLQEKRGQPGPRPDTQDRLFGSSAVKENPLRTQHLRDRDLQGRTYNLVTKAAVVDWPSQGGDRSAKHDYAFMAHPSQQSLERQRSAQGGVSPGDRSTGMIIF